MKQEYIRLIKQILKTETTLTPLLKIPKLESSEQRVRTKYCYLMDVMGLFIVLKRYHSAETLRTVLVMAWQTEV